MTETVYKLPLSPQAQKFSIILGNKVYNVTQKWNYVSQLWMLDFADTNDNPILQGVPLITGADLFEQYAYLGFGGQLRAQTDNNPSVPPNFTNLGSDANVYYVVDQ